jgi:hypothetical protein
VTSTEGTDGTDGAAGTTTTPPGGNDSTTTPPAGGKTFTQEELDRELDKRLKRERAKYADYDELKKAAGEAAAKAKANETLEQRVESLQREQAERDAAAVQEKADLAAERLHAKLVRGGLSDGDATALVETIDPLRLLADGRPSAQEIDKVAKTLTKIGTRSQADPDQGARGGNAAPSMNELIRAAANRNRVS